jgi:hypothetical protein
MQTIEQQIIPEIQEEVILYPELCIEWDLFVNELEFE